MVKCIEPSWEEMIERVAGSPKACWKILRVLRQRLAVGELMQSPWNEVSDELWQLSETWSRRR
ncbi:hypothetical protein GCM10027067_33890 [Pseudactinotalea suaedae]